MALSPKEEAFRGSIRIQYYCDASIMEFTLVDQVMRRVSSSGGVGGITCIEWEIEDAAIGSAVQRAENAIKLAINFGEGVYSVTQESSDLFMLSIPEAGVVTFKRIPITME